MLNRQTYDLAEKPPANRFAGRQTVDIGFREIFAFVKRYSLTIIVCVLVSMFAGAAYLLLTPPLYTAETSLLIDTRKLSIFGDGNVFEDASLNTASVESQLQIVQSGELVARAVDNLPAVAFDRLSAKPTPGLIGIVRSGLSGLIPSRGPPDDSAAPIDAPVLSAEDLAKIRAADAIQSELSVSRVGLSYVIDVSYVAPDPWTAAQVVKAVAQAYLEEQLNEQFTTAQRATKWLEGRLADLRRQVSDDTLSVGERNAVRETYDTFLQRYTETVQQQSLPLTEARVLTAPRPGKKTWPKTGLIAAGSVLLGLCMGVGLGLARELFDRRIESCEQAERVLGAVCFGALPKLAPGSPLLSARSENMGANPGEDERNLQFANALSFAADSIDRACNGGSAIIGVASANRGEGRSTVALGIAKSLATSGDRVLLIDADLREIALTRKMGLDGGSGLAQALIDGRNPMSEVRIDPPTQLHFLDGGSKACPQRSGEVFRMASFKSFLHSARDVYRYVILDLPAILSSSDAQIAAHRCDGLLFVVEASSTSEQDAVTALARSGVGDRVIGILLNKEDMTSFLRLHPRSVANLREKFSNTIASGIGKRSSVRS